MITEWLTAMMNKDEDGQWNAPINLLITIIIVIILLVILLKVVDRI